MTAELIPVIDAFTEVGGPGALALDWNPLPSIAEASPSTPTTTSTSPSVPIAGVTATTWVLVDDTTVPRKPPKLTEVALLRFVPVIVTVVDPLEGPKVGLKLVIDGTNVVTEADGAEAVEVPTEFVAFTVNV